MIKSPQETDQQIVNKLTNIFSFKDFQENYHKEYLTFFPLKATFAGIAGYDHLFPKNISEDYRENLKAFYTIYLDGLIRYDYESLAETDQVSYDILKWECEIGLEGLKYPTHLIPVDQMWSPNLTLGQFAGGTSAQPFKTVDDYNNWLKRIDAFIAWSETAMENMKKGIAQGYVLPATLIKKVIPQWESLASGVITEHLFFASVKMFPDSFPEDEKLKLTEAYTTMVSEKLIPMYARMTKFLKEEYLPNGRSTTGISALQQGYEFYQHRIKFYTHTNMSAEQIFELGKREVARIREEMEVIKSAVGYSGDLKSFFNYVRENKELTPFNDPDEVIANFDAIHNQMKPKLSEMFNLFPKAAFEVKRTEVFREASASAEYYPASKDGSRPGIFYVPIPNVKEYNYFSDQSLFLHEAIPGHHYQASLQQENESLPEFRKILWYSAYGEGWALYCESMGKELGLYDDHYQYFGMLSAEMHRALRLVIDPGIHTKGWTREEAIQYSLDNEAKSEESIIAEIERYIAMPGQALSYKIGQLKLLELKEKAKLILGDQFDIREFHNIVLAPGCIPLGLLEEKVHQWIALKEIH
ncbi:DUF885 domain-containing protein [soil metagenome]